MAKLQTFDKTLIRDYMKGTRTLEKGISYVRASNPSISYAQAKETAIRLAQDYCYQKWLRDSTGYIRNETIAFQEFTRDVDNNRYFAIPKKELKKQQEKNTKEQNEKARVERLAKYCQENHLCFEVENYKELKKLKAKDDLFGAIAFIDTIISVVALIYLIGIEQLTTFSFYALLIGWFVVVGIAGANMPDLPDNAFDELKRGSPISGKYYDPYKDDDDDDNDDE